MDKSCLRILWLDTDLPKYDRVAVDFPQLMADRIGAQVDFQSARNVYSARVRINSQTQPPDLLLMELQLSPTARDSTHQPPLIDMNAGFALWRELRGLEDHWANCVPIVIVTARCAVGLKETMTKDKHLRYLELPIALETIATEATKLLRYCAIVE